ncbi:GIN domain-containing protein [Flavobacterium sp. LB3P45]|uniref:GIN domain-containing protein n=1 Tax=Flavobacterium fructosi TaxID=3230416 RepID=A0ABW6HIG0_9FLAO
MKNNITIFLLILSTTLTLAQKKDKIKGSRIVTIENKEVNNFQALEVEDNIEVNLERGEKNTIKIEADDNLHDIISFDLKDNTLRIYTSKEAVNYKKLIVRVTYNSDLNLVTSKNEATINAIEQIQLDEITFKTFDYSKLFLNVNSKNFILQADDKSKTELNLKSEKTTIQLSKNAVLKSLLTTFDLKVDLYQKSNATLEGNATKAIIRLDNNSTLTGNKLIAKDAEIITERYTNCSLFIETNVIIDAADKSEIQLLGSPKIEMRQFSGEAKLFKKIN